MWELKSHFYYIEIVLSPEEKRHDVELIQIKGLFQNIPCENRKEPRDLITIISPTVEAHEDFHRNGYAILQFLEEKISEDLIKSHIQNIKTPYVFFAQDIYKFDEIDANFHRMIREGEFQNADVISGAFQVKKNKFFKIRKKFGLIINLNAVGRDV